jgi:predicted Abi (CAAX) family protease
VTWDDAPDDEDEEMEVRLVCLAGPRDDVLGRFFARLDRLLDRLLDWLRPFGIDRRDEDPLDFRLRPLFSDPDDFLRGAPFLCASFFLAILTLLKVDDFIPTLAKVNQETCRSSDLFDMP